MGVHGLRPFLERTCPQVIRYIPERLSALSGKTVVFDGTLITQRFHYAPMPQQYRHVLCWYRLMRSLKQHDVQAICVFDGGLRSVAKEPEAERRRQERQLAVMRGRFEVDRLRRLSQLSTSLQDWHLSDPVKREQALANIGRRIVESAKVHRARVLFPSRQSRSFDLVKREGYLADKKQLMQSTSLPAQPNVIDPAASLIQPQESTRPGLAARLLRMVAQYVLNFNWSYSAKLALLESVATDSIKNTSTAGADSPITTRTPIVNLEADVSSLVSEAVSKEDVPALTDTNPSLICSAIVSDRDSQVALSNKRNILTTEQEKLCDLLAESIASDRSPGSITGYAQEAEQIPVIRTALVDPTFQATLSKNQQNLTDEEGKLLDMLAKSITSHDLSEITKLAEDLEARSNVLSASYRRRTNAPTSSTYYESREILTAMGIPCVEPAGAFEGEALAASLVLNGYADYVASEDMDVLVYGAPLVRNIASTQEPLFIVDPAEVRAVLGLDESRFIDLALLMGTDFSQRIKNVGPARALAFIREHGSIERILEQETKYPLRMPFGTYLEQISLARNVFRTLPPLPHESVFKQGQVDEIEVMDILHRSGLRKYAVEDGDYSQALSGNYFADNPAAV